MPAELTVVIKVDRRHITKQGVCLFADVLMMLPWQELVEHPLAMLKILWYMTPLLGFRIGKLC